MEKARVAGGLTGEAWQTTPADLDENGTQDSPSRMEMASKKWTPLLGVQEGEKK